MNYLGGGMPVFQINFSRPAGQVVAQYYNFLRLGFAGYKGIHDASYEVGQYLASEIVKLGPFELLCDSNPATGIPTVTWRIRQGEDPGYTLFDLADRLRERGWQVPAYTLTGTASDISVQRILVRLGVSRGSGFPAPGRLPHCRGPLQQAPGHRVHDQGGVRRVQPPVGRYLQARPDDGPWWRWDTHVHERAHYSPRAIAAQNVCDTSATMRSENLTHNTLNRSGVAITDRTQGSLHGDDRRCGRGHGFPTAWRLPDPGAPNVYPGPSPSWTSVAHFTTWNESCRSYPPTEGLRTSRQAPGYHVWSVERSYVTA